MTGGGAGSSANANDLDGRTSVRSPAIRLSTAPGQRLFFRYVLAHGANSTSADRLVASIETSDGGRTPVITLTGKPADVDGVWRSVAASVDAWAGQTVRIHFAAVDGGSNSLVEVEIDDVRITRGSRAYPAGPVPGRSPGLRSLRRMRRRSLRRTPPGATRRPRPTVSQA